MRVALLLNSFVRIPHCRLVFSHDISEKLTTAGVVGIVVFGLTLFWIYRVDSHHKSRESIWWPERRTEEELGPSPSRVRLRELRKIDAICVLVRENTAWYRSASTVRTVRVPRIVSGAADTAFFQQACARNYNAMRLSTTNASQIAST